MVRYQVRCEQAQQRYIQFSAVFQQAAEAESLQLELPSWRPGRYEIGNFAKNIKADIENCNRISMSHRIK